MRAKEFGAWLSRKMGKDGRRTSGDEFNKSFKGEWPPKRYNEYASSDMEEYHSYPETKDTRTEQDDQQNNTTQTNKNEQSKKSNRKQRSPSQVARNVIGRVVAVSAGAIVVANSYVALGGELPFPVPFASVFSDIVSAADSTETKTEPDTAPSVTSKTWKWSEDHQTVTFVLSDEKGNILQELPATVQVVQIDPTCNTEGTKTYTATVEDGDEIYSDTRSEVLPATGHSFDNGTIITTEDGKPAIVFECIHCHEQFTISASVEEDE